jgi:hypothetical protein
MLFGKTPHGAAGVIAGRAGHDADDIQQTVLHDCTSLERGIEEIKIATEFEE